ncbi:hypothetical protein ABT282_08625 [Streptomyces sp. NPDC000927]|uniref:hypothetical protein n=1 Tax=Streptomyces sp. NPDC000927 TaxID=3154371 RepID=UPI003332130E
MTAKKVQRPSIADILRTLHDRPEDQLGYPMKLDHVHHRITKPTSPEEEAAGYGDTYDAAYGAQELGLVTGVDDEGRWHDEAILTGAGRAWSEGDELPAIRYVYRVDNEMAIGTLADWAKVWERNQYSGDILLSDTLRTWDNETGFRVEVDKGGTDNDWIDYRIWAAGELASARIDGRA